ncbi:unnamed protein product [Rotaria socialis]
MGSAPSNNRESNRNSIRPMAAIDPLQQHNSTNTAWAEDVAIVKHSKRPKTAHQEKEDIKWPLPPKAKEDSFQFQWPTDSERYSVENAYNARVPSKAKPIIEELVRQEYRQEKKDSNKWEKKNSSLHDSANVQSTMNTTSSTCVNLSSSYQIGALMSNMTDIQASLDVNVRYRLEKVSKETETVIQRIIDDATTQQDELLKYGEQRQMIYDELHREWLYKYIVALDEWQSKQLGEWQDELSEYQKRILNKSQEKIIAVNKQAAEIKLRILKEEQNNASSDANALLAAIESLSDKQALQNLGSEKTTEIKLLIRANVGAKLP